MQNEKARLAGLRVALAVLALVALLALFLSRRLPDVQPGAAPRATPTHPAEGPT